MRPELVSYGGKGKYHWGQVQCKKCGAWLREMPDRFGRHNYKIEGTNKHIYHYFWKCLRCGEERKIIDFSRPDSYTPNPQAELHEPGTSPPPVEPDPDKWRFANKLSPVEKRLVCECWDMLDPLAGKLTIHQVSYIWNLSEALESQDIRAVIKTAQEYVDMLDYEKVHGKEPGSYRGVEGDVTKIRLTLREIRGSTRGSNLSSNTGGALINISKKKTGVTSPKDSPAGDEKPSPSIQKKVEIINDAISKERLIRFSYTAANGVKTVRSIKPEAFRKYGDTLCVSGHCYLRNETRIFSLERMKRMKIVKEPGKSYETKKGEPLELPIPRFRKRTAPVILRDYDDEDGRRYLEAHLTPSGELEIEGQDLGPGVTKVLGEGFVEYEWFYIIKPEHIPLLVEALGARPGTDILNLLQYKCVGPYGLNVEEIIRKNKIPFKFWNHWGE